MSSFMFETSPSYQHAREPPNPTFYSESSNLQFYSSGNDPQYYDSRPSLEGNMVSGATGAPQSGFGGTIQQPMGWLSAFSSVGLEGEPPLLEELGINFSHIRAKALTVLNPLQRIDERIMDDADMAGPIIFCFCFGMFLLLSGRSQFGYIYGIALLGSASIYLLLNLMSPSGIDAYRTASVLGYCLLPMVGVGALSVTLKLNSTLGYLLSSISVLWCTYSASSIFVTVLRMSDQRLLVAYPVGLLYGCFALFSVFDIGAAA
ncbi:hypothetical protein FRC03_011334 [Tulasnella sp. 419]|nr:hypothetical protein FRC03_011334 [Tulasnella sp. 419]